MMNDRIELTDALISIGISYQQASRQATRLVDAQHTVERDVVYHGGIQVTAAIDQRRSSDVTAALASNK
jgi:hypothetical protein